MADDVVDSGADDQQQIRFAERRGARGRERQLVVVGDDATTLRGGVERNASPFDELLKLGLGG